MILKNVKIGPYASLVEADKKFKIFHGVAILDESQLKEIENISKGKGEHKSGIIPIMDGNKEPTGERGIKIRSNYKPKIVDSNLNKISPSDIFMGSICNINIEIKDNSFRTVYFIKAIQVVELIENMREYQEKYIGGEGTGFESSTPEIDDDLKGFI